MQCIEYNKENKLLLNHVYDILIEFQNKINKSNHVKFLHTWELKEMKEEKYIGHELLTEECLEIHKKQFKHGHRPVEHCCRKETKG